MAKPSGAEIKTNIQAEDGAVWDQADARPDGLDLFEDDLANAIAGAWADVEDGLAIASVAVSGGSSAPGGPLASTLAPLAARTGGAPAIDAVPVALAIGGVTSHTATLAVP